MYTITIEKSGITNCGAYDMPSTTVNTLSFETLKEARKEVRRQIKHEGFKKHAGHIYKHGFELFTNF